MMPNYNTQNLPTTLDSKHKNHILMQILENVVAPNNPQDIPLIRWTILKKAWANNDQKAVYSRVISFNQYKRCREWIEIAALSIYSKNNNSILSTKNNNSTGL